MPSKMLPRIPGPSCTDSGCGGGGEGGEEGVEGAAGGRGQQACARWGGYVCCLWAKSDDLYQGQGDAVKDVAQDTGPSCTDSGCGGGGGGVGGGGKGW